MVQLLIATLAMLVILTMSLNANRRFAQYRSIPMQWSLSGTPNWHAPRKYAFAFIPGLAAVTLTLAVFGTIAFEPKPGQAGMEVPVILILSFGLTACHWFHIWMVGKSLDKDG